MTQISAKEMVLYVNRFIDPEAFLWGDEKLLIGAFCSLQQIQDNSITWVKNISNDACRIMEKCKNNLVVIPDVPNINTKNITFLVTRKPKAVFFGILDNFWGKEPIYEIAETAVIRSGKVGEHVSIGHHSFVDSEVIIGNGVVIENNVSILNKVIIGNNCIIHSGTVIGTDGFGYYINEDGMPNKVKHFGGVRIGNNVEIGANVCIDRGTIDDTVIKENCKIDNLVHIAHNAYVGKNAMVVAGTIVCGSVRLGENSYIAPGGIVKNQLRIGENSLVGMGAVVTKNVEDNWVVAGIPAKKIRQVDLNDK